jgi:hypothetical protein
MKVLITQSMLFPWVGMLEQIRLADVIVHYDDVQFSKGSFTNRVQVKTANGLRWMTVPLRNLRLGQVIDEVEMHDISVWGEQHMALLKQGLQGAPYAQDAFELMREVYASNYNNLGALARASMLKLAHYFGLLEKKRVIDVRDLGIGGSSSSRVLEVVRAVGGDVYITGHGARKYLDHEAFERANVEVRYMQYTCQPYPQTWGEFTPYVTGLDLVAHCGQQGAEWIISSAVPWRKFLADSLPQS